MCVWLQYRWEMLRITYFIATIIQMTKYREYFSCFWWIGTRENDILWHCYIPSRFNVKCTSFFSYWLCLLCSNALHFDSILGSNFRLSHEVNICDAFHLTFCTLIVSFCPTGRHLNELSKLNLFGQYSIAR